MTWEFPFLGGGTGFFFWIHFKVLYKPRNDYTNHIECFFWSFETCLRHIRTHQTVENYFLTLDFGKLPPENRRKSSFWPTMPLQRLVLSFYAYKQRILLPAVRVYGNYILRALKVLNVDAFEDCEPSTKSRVETRGDMKKMMPCAGHCKLHKVLANVDLFLY